MQYLVVVYVVQDADSPERAVDQAKEAINETYWPAYVQPWSAVSQAGLDACLINAKEVICG